VTHGFDITLKQDKSLECSGLKVCFIPCLWPFLLLSAPFIILYFCLKNDSPYVLAQKAGHMDCAAFIIEWKAARDSGTLDTPEAIRDFVENWSPGSSGEVECIPLPATLSVGTDVASAPYLPSQPRGEKEQPVSSETISAHSTLTFNF
jgi:hypothetical protein